MYRVLYRKFRPQLFSDVVGQEYVTSILRNEIVSSRVSHAYLFIGSRGTGKTSCAKILAKAVNCLNPKDGNPCNECEICRGIDDGSIVDVVEIDAASNNRVENIRDIRDEVNYTPVRAKYRVYIVDEVHMLTSGAFNALLKTLEEPPAHVVFILATTEAHKLPATILSRCQRFNFNRISPEDISKRLKFVCEKEGFRIDDDAALLIARLADGAMRDALSILDQCTGIMSDVTVSSVSRSVGLVGTDYLFDIADAIYSENTEYLINCVDSLYNSSADMERLCSEMCDFFRNCLICKVSKSPEKIIAFGKSEIKKYCSVAEKFSYSRLLDIIDKIRQMQDRLRLSLNRRVDMEILLVSLSNPKLSFDASSMLARIEALERGQNGTKLRAIEAESDASNKNTHQAPAKEVKNPEPTSSSDSSHTKLCSEDVSSNKPEHVEVKNLKTQNSAEKKLFLQWPEVLQEIKSLSMPLFAIMYDSKAYFHEGCIYIDAPNPAFKDCVKKNPSVITEALSRVCSEKYTVKMYKNVNERGADKPLDALSGLIDRAEKLGIPVKND